MERYRQRKKKKKCNAVQLLVKQTTLRVAHGKRQRTKTGSDLLAKLSFDKGSTVSAGEAGREREMLHKRRRREREREGESGGALKKNDKNRALGEIREKRQEDNKETSGGERDKDHQLVTPSHFNGPNKKLAVCVCVCWGGQTMSSHRQKHERNT